MPLFMRKRAYVRAIVLAAACSACKGDRRPAASLRASPSNLDLAPGTCATVTLDWSPLRALDKLHGKPLVFVHLLDRPIKPFQVLRTFDHPLPRRWRAGESQRDEIPICQSALGPPLGVGRYLLTVGLYDDSWGYRWPLAVDGPLIARREYRIAGVQATSIRKRAPTFGFTGGWQETERGNDGQVVARRRLRGAGTLAVSGVGEAGTVRMAIAVAPTEADVRIESDCSRGFSETLEPGLHWTGVTASGESGTCEIRFAASAPKSGEDPSLSLEVLGWEPAKKD
jgi:hypothetical protein